MNIDKIVLNELLGLLSENKAELFNQISAERTNHINVVVENLYQEHNASAVLRTCDCYGINKMHVIENINKYKVNRDIALGAGKWVDTETHNQGEKPTLECIKALRERGYKILATTPHTDDFNIYNVPINEPMAVFFGTEMDGLSEEVLNEADYKVNIPMYGFTESFNISVSAAILLSNLRNRLESSDLNWKLNEAEQTTLMINWCIRTLIKGEKIEQEIRRRIIGKEL